MYKIVYIWMPGQFLDEEQAEALKNYDPNAPLHERLLVYFYTHKARLFNIRKNNHISFWNILYFIHFDTT